MTYKSAKKWLERNARKISFRDRFPMPLNDSFQRQLDLCRHIISSPPAARKEKP